MKSPGYQPARATLKVKFTAFFSGVAVLVCLSGWLFHLQITRIIENELWRRSQAVAENLANNPNLKLALVNEDPVLVRDLLQAAVRERDVEFAAIEATGSRFEVAERAPMASRYYASHLRLRGDMGSTSSKNQARQKLDTGEEFFLIRVPVQRVQTKQANDESLLLGALDSSPQIRPRGPTQSEERLGFVSIGVSFKGISGDVRKITWSASGLLALMVLLFAAFLLAVFRFVLRPVEAVTESATRIASGDLSQRVPVIFHDEIGSLAHNFNVMAANLAGQTATKDRFANELLAVNKELQRSKDGLEEAKEEMERQFEQAVEAKLQWESTFSAMSDAIFVIDASRRLRQYNSAAAALGGFWKTLRESGGNIANTFRSSDPSLAAAWDNALSSSERTVFELEDPAEKRDYIVTAEPLGKGSVLGGGVIIITRDITEREQLREQLIQSEKMGAIGQLVAGVAHELNNPLTSVLGYSQLCLDGEGLSEEMRSFLQSVVSEGLRAKRIVENLLTFSRQHVSQKRLVSVNDLLRQTAELRSYDHRVCGVDIEERYDGTLPLSMCDPHQLQQVFLNILLNAEQAMRASQGGGKITLETHKLGDDRIGIVISDNGPGIPQEHLTKIFDPFFTTKGIGEGTGLGLSITHGIIVEHGGRIWAESEPGRGASFSIELPVVEGNSHSPSSDSKPGPIPNSRKRILVVDDESAITTVLVTMLQRQGHDVEAVSDGKTALERIAESGYDLIISDIQMPGMSGPELYENLREMGNGLAEKVVFITGDTVKAETQHFLSQSGSRYLMKPFSLKDILFIVHDTSAGPEAFVS